MRRAGVDVSARVSDHSLLGEQVTVWGLAHIRERAKIGSGSIIGEGAYIGPGVEIGQNCKIQNYALIYEPASLADGVFIGPGAILTNDLNPRAITVGGNLKIAGDWQSDGVVIEKGASIGAGSICIAPITIGAWAMVAAGSVVTANVPGYALVMGVPARQRGWVGKSGHTLFQNGDIWICPSLGDVYKIIDGHMTIISQQ